MKWLTIWRYGRRGALLLLLLALTMNYAVAWGGAMWSPLRWEPMPDVPKEVIEEEGYPEPWIGGPDQTLGYWHDGYGVGYAEYQSAYFWMGEFRTRHTDVYTRDAGWPFFSHRSSIITQDEEHDESYTDLYRWELPWYVIIHRGLQTDDLPAWFGADGMRRLPIVPLWPGFLWNMLIYLVVAALMLNVQTLLNAMMNWKTKT